MNCVQLVDVKFSNDVGERKFPAKRHGNKVSVNLNEDVYNKYFKSGAAKEKFTIPQRTAFYPPKNPAAAMAPEGQGTYVLEFLEDEFMRKGQNELFLIR